MFCFCVIFPLFLKLRTAIFCNYGSKMFPVDQTCHLYYWGHSIPKLSLSQIKIQHVLLTLCSIQWLPLFIMMNIRCHFCTALTVTSGSKGETNGSVWVPAQMFWAQSASGLVSCILPCQSSNISYDDDEISYIAFSFLVINWSSYVCKTIPLFSVQKWILPFVR